MKKRIISAILCILMIITFGGCASSDSRPSPEFKKVVKDSAENRVLLTADKLIMPPALTQITAEKTELILEKGSSLKLSYVLSPEEAWNKAVTFSSSDENIAAVDENGKVVAVSVGECSVTVASSEIPSVSATYTVKVKAPVIAPPPPPVTNDNDTASSDVTELTYISGILIANKTYALPSDYNPGVNAEAYAALMQMFEAAKADGIGFWVASGFRSYAHQNRIYNNYVAQDGKAAADRYSARPGHSEHQTGLAFDLNNLTQAFGQTAQGIWLKENCHKYGFIIRYPEGKEHITGYMYEPWHVRYLGVDVATAVYESGLCLEEYLGITSVYAEQ